MDPFSIEYFSAMGLVFTVGGIGIYLFTADPIALWMAGIGLLLFFIAGLGTYTLIRKYHRAMRDADANTIAQYRTYEWYSHTIKRSEDLAKFNHSDFN